MRHADSELVLVDTSSGVAFAGGLVFANQTRCYLNWLDSSFRDAGPRGLDMNELLRASVPAEFRDGAAFNTEYTRNVAHLYPRYELIPLHCSTVR